MTRIYSKFSILILFLSFSLLFGSTKQPVRAKKGMVVSGDSFASDVGREILKKGGNAVDAAVATGFALAVTHPAAGNIGGGGFMVIRLEDGTETTIDFREKAPYKAHRDVYLDEEGNYVQELSREGWTSSGVPGSVAGLIYALEKYGTLSLAEVIQPAIELAEKGFKISYHLAESINKYHDKFIEYPSSKEIFTSNGEKLNEGFLFVQRDLANTLRIIKEKGASGFYKGEIAKLIVKSSEENEGFISLKDLDDYKPLERKPATGSYRGYKIISMPPPSSGGIALIQTLNVLENYSFDTTQWGGSEYIHTVSEALKYVYADRFQHLGDPEFHHVPQTKLISKDYAKSIFLKINQNANPSSEISPSSAMIDENDQTTHYSVVDLDGNTVSTTVTLNSSYGNRIVVNGAGFLMNNEMDDFSSKPGEPNLYGLIGSEANSIQPGKRMLSSMTPTIVLKDEKPVLVIGGRGGSKIITAVLQVVLNCIDFNMDIQKAIDMPRFHHQWLPDRIDYEKFGMSEDVKNNLIERGQNIGIQGAIGNTQGIWIDFNEDIIYGGTDSRENGKASGY